MHRWSQNHLLAFGIGPLHVRAASGGLLTLTWDQGLKRQAHQLLGAARGDLGPCSTTTASNQ
jgi:hypothetical protein